MKSRNLFIGVLILFTGVVALLVTLHVFEFHWSILWSLWPMILIICGISMLPLNEYLKTAILLVALGIGCLLYAHESSHYEGNAVSRFFNRHFTVWDWDNDDDDDDEEYGKNTAVAEDAFAYDQHFSEPFHEVAKASMELDFGAGDLKLGGPCAELAKVDINSNFVKYSFRTERGDDQTSIFVSGKGQKKRYGKGNTNDLDMALCTQPIWSFNIDMGAADADLDFTPYKVENIEINGGACDLDIKLGDNGCDTKMDISTGASDIDIMVPSQVDCQIRIESAITGKDFKGFEKVERGLWQTPGFGQSEHQIIIDMSCAVSDISIERY
ncbi:MAG: hypothetical protein IKT08_07245 [Bacteroidales bacterium]|nr:hypothetical protein [Bacteroidales bacterium]